MIRYERFLDLSSLMLLEAEEVETLVEPGRTIYAIEFSFSNEYFQRQSFRDFRVFGQWVRREFPESNFPYYAPSYADMYMAQIRGEMLRRVPDIDQLNRWVSHSKFGSFTRVEHQFFLSYFDREPLENFLLVVRQYTLEHDCQVMLTNGGAGGGSM